MSNPSSRFDGVKAAFDKMWKRSHDQFSVAQQQAIQITQRIKESFGDNGSIFACVFVNHHYEPVEPAGAVDYDSEKRMPYFCVGVWIQSHDCTFVRIFTIHFARLNNERWEILEIDGKQISEPDGIPKIVQHMELQLLKDAEGSVFVKDEPKRYIERKRQ
ncbi:MAG TPA: hypothetical protein VFV87_10350 [Pirellulaceae bacterium]|nr:hypothetical protein [Pirellulaceae bacterium]